MPLHIPVLFWSGLIWRFHPVNYVLDLVRCPRVAVFSIVCGIAPEALFSRLFRLFWIVQVGEDTVSLFLLRAAGWRGTEFVLLEHNCVNMKILLIKCFYVSFLENIYTLLIFSSYRKFMFNHVVPVYRWEDFQLQDSTTARRSLCLWGCIHWRVCSRSIGPLESVGEGEEEKRDIFR